MSLFLEYRRDAQDDIDAAYAWYEEQRSGLGPAFLEALQTHLAQIQAHPEMYAVLHRRVRGAPMKRYPYVVYYRVESDRIVIIAVVHGRRHARVWRSRA